MKKKRDIRIQLINTLSMECMNFYNLYGRDGRNYTARAVYECYYDPYDSDFVVIDFNPQKTLMQLIFFSVIPGTIMIVSCMFVNSTHFFK